MFCKQLLIILWIYLLNACDNPIGPAAKKQGVWTGNVYNQKNVPLENVKIQIFTLDSFGIPSSKEPQIVYTNSKGQYSFNGVAGTTIGIFYDAGSLLGSKKAILLKEDPLQYLNIWLNTSAELKTQLLIDETVQYENLSCWLKGTGLPIKLSNLGQIDQISLPPGRFQLICEDLCKQANSCKTNHIEERIIHNATKKFDLSPVGLTSIPYLFSKHKEQLDAPVGTYAKPVYLTGKVQIKSLKPKALEEMEFDTYHLKVYRINNSTKHRDTMRISNYHFGKPINPFKRAKNENIEGDSLSIQIQGEKNQKQSLFSAPMHLFMPANNHTKPKVTLKEFISKKANIIKGANINSLNVLWKAELSQQWHARVLLNKTAITEFSDLIDTSIATGLNALIPGKNTLRWLVHWKDSDSLKFKDTLSDSLVFYNIHPEKEFSIISEKAGRSKLLTEKTASSKDMHLVDAENIMINGSRTLDWRYRIYWPLQGNGEITDWNSTNSTKRSIHYDFFSHNLIATNLQADKNLESVLQPGGYTIGPWVNKSKGDTIESIDIYQYLQKYNEQPDAKKKWKSSHIKRDQNGWKYSGEEIHSGIIKFSGKRPEIINSVWSSDTNNVSLKFDQNGIPKRPLIGPLELSGKALFTEYITHDGELEFDPIWSPSYWASARGKRSFKIELELRSPYDTNTWYKTNTLHWGDFAIDNAAPSILHQLPTNNDKANVKQFQGILSSSGSVDQSSVLKININNDDFSKNSDAMLYGIQFTASSENTETLNLALNAFKNQKFNQSDLELRKLLYGDINANSILMQAPINSKVMQDTKSIDFGKPFENLEPGYWIFWLSTRDNQWVSGPSIELNGKNYPGPALIKDSYSPYEAAPWNQSKQWFEQHWAVCLVKI